MALPDIEEQMIEKAGRRFNRASDLSLRMPRSSGDYDALHVAFGIIASLRSGTSAYRRHSKRELSLYTQSLEKSLVFVDTLLDDVEAAISKESQSA